MNLNLGYLDLTSEEYLLDGIDGKLVLGNNVLFYIVDNIHNKIIYP